MTIADDKAGTAAILDAQLRAGHIEPAGYADDGQPCYRVTAAGVAWAQQVVMGEKPRTWSLPVEPGPEVRFLRDANGVGLLWSRYPGVRGEWQAMNPADGSLMLRLWHELLLRGPLTDATGEQS